MIATICLPLISLETGKLITATDLEIELMHFLNSVDREHITEVELMTENCYEITVNEQ